jgi:hypothetical protein
MNNLDQDIQRLQDCSRREGEAQLLLKIMSDMANVQTVEEVWAMLRRLVEERTHEEKLRARAQNRKSRTNNEVIAKRNQHEDQI